MRKQTKFMAVLSAAAIMTAVRTNDDKLFRNLHFLRDIQRGGWKKTATWYFYDEDGYKETNTWKKKTVNGFTWMKTAILP